MKTLSYLFFFCMILVSCETKDLISAKETNYTRGDLNEGTMESSVDFDGIQSITQVTDSSMTITWNEIDGVSSYYIYKLIDGSPTFIQSVYAGTDNLLISNLVNSTEYTFLVRVKDEEGQLDANEVTLSATTLSSPAAPSVITMADRLFNYDSDTTPSVLVFGVNPGDTVRVFSDDCSTQIGSTVSTLSYANVQIDELDSGSTYTFKADRYTVNKQVSDCSSNSVTYQLEKCPHGYVYVPKNEDLATSAFCIMKYEAKPWSDSDSDNKVDSVEVHSLGCNESDCTTVNWGTTSYKPGSSAYGHPWRMITIETAKELCQDLGDDYDLVSNSEWMAVAKLVEENDNNWTGGVVGSGKLFKGNNGVDGTYSYDSSYSTGVDLGIGRDSLAMHTYNDGTSSEEIWDLSGNVAEWIDWGQESYVSFLSYSCLDDWAELTSSFCGGKLDEDDYLPFNPADIDDDYDNDYGLGYIEGGQGRALVRGGSYRNGEYTGVFNMTFAYGVGAATKDIGFRCVYRNPAD